MSFRLDANCPSDISSGRDYTPVICVKGANASGKTQVLKALSFLGLFCADSFSSNPDTPITLVGFFDSTEPSEFYAEFAIGINCYRYELVADDKEVVRETLYRTKVRKVPLFERVGKKITYATKAMRSLKGIVLRDNASVISTMRQHKISNTELDSVWRFFRFMESNVSFAGMRETHRDIQSVSKFLFETPEVFEFVKSFIRECDTGISDIKIMDIKDPDNETRFAPVFFHEVGGVAHPIVAMVESSGTKALYRSLASYYLAIRSGGIVVADEIDINLHPFVLSKIIDLFLDTEINSRGAQLVFSTHNSEVLDQLGRYRTYLVNKADNQSFAYRLDEIPGDILRNDRPISPSYRSGKIGGVPKL